MLMSDPVKIIAEGIFESSAQYIRKSDEWFDDIVEDVHSGHLFGSWMLPNESQNALHKVFLPLKSYGPLDQLRLKRDDIVHFCGPPDASFRKCIGIYPMVFNNVMEINREDASRLLAMVGDVPWRG